MPDLDELNRSVREVMFLGYRKTAYQIADIVCRHYANQEIVWIYEELFRMVSKGELIVTIRGDRIPVFMKLPPR